jgi:hypothetical protein
MENPYEGDPRVRRGQEPHCWDGDPVGLAAEEKG